MNKLKKSLALIATLAMASSALFACGDSSSTKPAESKADSSKAAEESKPAEESKGGEESKDESGSTASNIKFEDGDTKLSVLSWTGDDLNAMIKNFSENTDYNADQIVWVPQGTSGGEAREKYATYFAGGDDVDLMFLEADWILDYINNDEYTAPLTDLGFTKDDFKGCYEYTVAIGTDDKGNLKGATWQATPGAYVYRTDLAEKYLGAKTQDEMQAKVKDWDTFLASAETVKTASNGKTAMIDTLGGLWQVYQYNRSSAWADKDDKLVIDDYCKTYAELAKKCWDEKYVTKEAQWDPSGAWYSIGQDGSTLGYFFCTWCLGENSMLSNAEGGIKMKDKLDADGNPQKDADGNVIQEIDYDADGKVQPKNPDLFGKYDIVNGPSSWAWGGTWFAVSPKCNNGTLAHDFVKYFTVDEASMEKYALAKSEFVNNPKVMKKIVDDKSNKNPLLVSGDQFAILYDAASKIDMTGKITAFDSQIKDKFNGVVTKYVKGEIADYDAMIEQFKKDCGSIEGLVVE
jgi:ABC-type glycerol-3-phosphate transport system substrate-binding protein